MAATSQMSGNMHEDQIETVDHYASTSTYVKVWIGLFILTAFEVIIASLPIDFYIKATLILVSSFFKAAAVVGFYMHLLFEKERKFITTAVFIVPLLCLVPMVIIVVVIPLVLGL